MADALKNFYLFILCVFCFNIIQNIQDKGRTFVDFSMLYQVIL